MGNEKGGCGKSTTAMHVLVALLKSGHRVGSIDLDGRQRTLSRYIENRRIYAAKQGPLLPLPLHRVVAASPLRSLDEAEADEAERLDRAVAELGAQSDFIVIDCPGSDTNLARLGHSYAATLVTPLNDSFVDLDLLASVDPETFEIIRPSHYAELVWGERKRRMLREAKSIDWVVLRNRLSNLDAHNKRRVGRVLNRLAGRIGFRVAPGFGERVIYRELFLKGLTLLDLRDEGVGTTLTMSHLAGRQELRNLIATLALPGLDRGALAV